MLRPSRAHLILTLLILGLAVLTVGCGEDADDEGSATAAGGKPSELTVYSGRNEDLVQPLFDRYEKESGIKLNVRYGDTAELAATIVEEGDNSPADVFVGQDAGALGALQDHDRLIRLPQRTLARVDERFRSSRGMWVGLSARARIIAYDTRRLSEEEVPASVLDLTDARWKGKVGWAPTNASFQASVTALRKLRGDDVAKEWLQDMKANGTKAFDSNGAVRDAVAKGEVEVGLINHYYVLQADAENGSAKYPVGVGFTAPEDPGSLVNVAGGGVLETSGKKAAGIAMLDYLLGPEAQRYFLEKSFEYPVATGAPSPEGVPALAEIDQPDIDLSDLADLEATLALIEEAGVL